MGPQMSFSAEYEVSADDTAEAAAALEGGGDNWRCTALGYSPGSAECGLANGDFSEENIRAMIVDGAEKAATAICAAYGAGAAAPLCGVAAGWITENAWKTVSSWIGGDNAAEWAAYREGRAQEAAWLGYLEAVTPAWEETRQIANQAVEMVRSEWHPEFGGECMGALCFSGGGTGDYAQARTALLEAGGAQLARVGSLMFQTAPDPMPGSPARAWTVPHPSNLWMAPRAMGAEILAQTDPQAAAEYAIQVFELYAIAIQLAATRAIESFSALEVEAAASQFEPAILTQILVQWEDSTESQRAAVLGHVEQIADTLETDGWQAVAPGDRVVWRLAAAQAMTPATFQQNHSEGEAIVGLLALAVGGAWLLLRKK